VATCDKIKGKRRKVCIGDLDRLVKLENRSITAPSDGVDYTETFTNKQISGSPIPSGEVWAMIESVSGETVFDATNIERDVTHRIYIRFISGITASTWILFEGIRFNILDVEDLDFRHEFQLLRCTIRGTSSRSNNAA